MFVGVAPRRDGRLCAGLASGLLVVDQAVVRLLTGLARGLASRSQSSLGSNAVARSLAGLTVVRRAAVVTVTGASTEQPAADTTAARRPSSGRSTARHLCRRNAVRTTRVVRLSVPSARRVSSMRGVFSVRWAAAQLVQITG